MSAKGDPRAREGQGRGEGGKGEGAKRLNRLNSRRVAGAGRAQPREFGFEFVNLTLESSPGIGLLHLTNCRRKLNRRVDRLERTPGGS